MKKKRPKALIATWCYGNGRTNYGQLLQCYAMQRLIEQCGFEVQIINYRERDKKELFPKPSSFTFLNWINEIHYRITVVEKGYTRRIGRFLTFIRKNIHLSNPCYSKEDVEILAKGVSLCVCGSDQIWNPLWMNEILLLGFGQTDVRRIAYAPSGVFDQSDYANEKYRQMAKYIDKLDAVSVREEIGAEILQQYVNKPVETALDPVLLLDCREWNIVATKRRESEPYVFCYLLGELRAYIPVFREIMRKYHVKKILAIPSNLVNPTNISFIDYVKDAGPAEFIALIKNAQAVCTDSFHGSAIALIYQKQLYTMARRQQHASVIASENRLQNLYDKAGIGNRKVKCVKDVQALAAIDYNKTNELLQKERDKSEAFLGRNLLPLAEGERI